MAFVTWKHIARWQQLKYASRNIISFKTLARLSLTISSEFVFQISGLVLFPSHYFYFIFCKTFHSSLKQKPRQKVITSWSEIKHQAIFLSIFAIDHSEVELWSRDEEILSSWVMRNSLYDEEFRVSSWLAIKSK